MNRKNSVLLQKFPASKRYLIGVSGGWDSMALLEVLFAVGYSNLVVCHLNHQLRGEASDGDAEFVRAQAASRGLTCEIEAEDVGARAKRERRSIETAARYARYEFFGRCSQKHGIKNLFLAHHAHDQAETMLMNLCRGAGLRGLSGMREVSTHGSLTVIRPFLRQTRADIPAPSFHRQDASNFTRQFSRNRVRLDLMAALANVLGRDPSPGLVRTAEILAEEGDYLALEAERSLVRCLMYEGYLRVRILKAMHIAIQRRVIRLWLSDADVPDVSFEDVEAVRGLLEGGRPARINLAGGRHVARRKKTLILELYELA